MACAPTKKLARGNLEFQGISSWTRVCEGHSVEPCASSVTSAIPSTPSCFELTGPAPSRLRAMLLRAHASGARDSGPNDARIPSIGGEAGSAPGNPEPKSQKGPEAGCSGGVSVGPCRDLGIPSIMSTIRLPARCFGATETSPLNTTSIRLHYNRNQDIIFDEWTAGDTP